MWKVLLPVSQVMPMFDPLGWVIGCMILICLAATYVVGLVAIPAAPWTPTPWSYDEAAGHSGRE